jgi:hypothetical protein
MVDQIVNQFVSARINLILLFVLEMEIAFHLIIAIAHQVMLLVEIVTLQFVLVSLQNLEFVQEKETALLQIIVFVTEDTMVQVVIKE